MVELSGRTAVLPAGCFSCDHAGGIFCAAIQRHGEFRSFRWLDKAPSVITICDAGGGWWSLHMAACGSVAPAWAMSKARVMFGDLPLRRRAWPKFLRRWRYWLTPGVGSDRRRRASVFPLAIVVRRWRLNTTRTGGALLLAAWTAADATGGLINGRLSCFAGLPVLEDSAGWRYAFWNLALFSSGWCYLLCRLKVFRVNYQAMETTPPPEYGISALAVLDFAS